MGLDGFKIAELSSPMTRMLWCFFFVLIAKVAAVPRPQQSAPAGNANPSACAEISSATAALLAASPSATPTVPASVAFECLQSVPNKPEPAQQLVTSVKAFVEWQSTLAWLKDPPASYMLPPVDVQGSLDNISATAESGEFASEYEFQLAMLKIFMSAHDGHFAYTPDIFKAFVFSSDLASDIVSVSVDGKQLPKLYHLDSLASNATTEPVAITQINGQDAAEYITDLTLKFSAFQDPDSQWNTQFPTYAKPSGALVVAASLAYLGPSLTLTYENGEEKTEDNYAIVREDADFSNVESGEDFYNQFCNPDMPSATASASATASSVAPAATSSAAAAESSEPALGRFPEPVVMDSGSGTLSGYFLNGTEYEDVAVLSVLSFAPTGDVGSVEYLTDFQDTIESFLSQSSDTGKQRLVIDVTGNGGGFVVAGFELFAQLFPDVEQFGANNLRLADSIVNIARVVDSIPGDFTPGTTNEQLALQVISQSSITSNLLPGGVFTPEGESFASVDEIISPVSLMNDFFTAYQNTPLNMPAADFNLTGTGSRSDPRPAVFDPENVVLLTDGTCGSTCTIFSYLMLFQLNIKATAVGGRPQTGSMQSIAGVEGAQVFTLPEISSLAGAVIALSPEDRQEELLGGELGTLAQGYALQRAADPTNAGSVNGKNAFSPSDSQTPLQFMFEPANCRFFYTAQMLSQPELVWQRTVDATWTDPENFCVEGSQMPNNQTREVDPLFRLGANTGSESSTIDDSESAAFGAPRGNLLVALLVTAAAAALVSCW